MMAFPKLVRGAKTPVQLVITTGEPNEFGENEVLLEAEFLCNYQDAAAVKRTTDKRALEVSGTIYIDGDILPTAAVIASGYATIFGERRTIVNGTKARNLDGTVNYTRLDVV